MHTDNSSTPSQAQPNRSFFTLFKIFASAMLPLGVIPALLAVVVAAVGKELWDAQGQPITQTLDGWHVNVFLMPVEDGSVLEAYTVYPLTPSRVWA